MNDAINTNQLYFKTFEMMHLLNITSTVLVKERNNKYLGKVNGDVRPKLKWLIK